MSIFNYLYENSAFTIEGFAKTEEDIIFFKEWLKSHGAATGDDIRLHWISGKEMNDHYHLTGDNAYQDGLNIVVVEPEDIDLMKLIASRFEIGGRWFDDIVDNNARREQNKAQ